MWGHASACVPTVELLPLPAATTEVEQDEVVRDKDSCGCAAFNMGLQWHMAKPFRGLLVHDWADMSNNYSAATTGAEQSTEALCCSSVPQLGSSRCLGQRPS